MPAKYIRPTVSAAPPIPPAVSGSSFVLGTWIDAEFLSDMGELFRVHETAVCHHRAQGR